MDSSGSSSSSSTGAGGTKRQASPAVAPTNKKKRTIKREPNFPPEVWEQIFRFFAGRQLLKLRLVSRRWNGVISGSSMLASRFNVRFKYLTNINAGYSPVNLPPLVARASFSHCTIEAVDSWWSGFGAKLVHLTIDGSTIGMQTLFGMLHQTTNLKTLRLTGVTMSPGPAEPTFQLSRLEKLDVHSMHYTSEQQVNILNGFERVFPCLKHLSVDVAERKTDILQSIRTLQRTLQYIDLRDSDANILSELCEMNDLQLKKVSFNVKLPRDLDLWTRFCRKQSQVEELEITADTGAVLRDTGLAMPRLKRLRLTLSKYNTVAATFLETMKALEVIEIFSECVPELHFDGQSSPNLEEISLEGIICPDLDQYLQQSPKLRKINLEDSCVYGKLPFLTAGFGNLRCLKMFNAQIDLDLLLSIASRSELLEELDVVLFKDLENETVREILKMCKRLKRINLWENRWLTDAIEKDIARYERAQEQAAADLCGDDAASEQDEEDD